MKLSHLVEPLGVEHRPEEIADCLLQALAYGATLTGAMARGRRTFASTPPSGPG